ncbi:MAG TPA: methyltransferase domain-containing protein [Solirubrobacteraceae bacterium]|nr:methyltransferase domain-containing protein [Solirubrobacteraceae bacterium]
MSSIPRDAAIGFDRGAVDYERGRPGYPPAAIAILASELGLGLGRRVVDLAAGTGKLTRALAGLGADLVAVEPVAGMRAQLERAVPGVEALEGTAERMPFPDGDVDAVVVAQAFHWFDIPAAAAEIHRVLSADGGLGIIRNEWDESVGWVTEMRELIRARAGRPPRNHQRDWAAGLEATGLFTSLSERVVANPIRVDADTLAARIGSMSYIAMMDEEQRTALLDDIRELVQTRGVVGADGGIETPYDTHVRWCRRRAAR